MIDGPLLILVVVTALGSGLVSGILFVFSTFVMQAFRRLPSEQGIAAMQSVNITAVTPPFMIVFFGTAAAFVGTSIWGIVDWTEPTSFYLLTGAGIYLIGVILVTIVFNVPRNNKLAAYDPKSSEATKYWETYLREWTRWNHVRTVTALLASGVLIIAIITS